MQPAFILHALEDAGPLDVDAFERGTLDRLGMPREIVMRHRIPHFLHIMGGYAAGYYSYLWSEVMDADAFAAFQETGDAFDGATAKKLHKYIYSGGNQRDPLEAYVAFRGRPPEIAGLLKKHIYSAGNRRDPAEAYVAFRGRPPEIRGLLKQRGFAA